MLLLTSLAGAFYAASSPPCVHAMWPSLLPERDKHMRALMADIHACEPAGVVRATRLTELHRESDGRITSSHRNMSGPGFPLARDEKLGGSVANAITQIRMIRLIARRADLADDDYVLIFENDAVLHPRARRLSAGQRARLITWAIGAARARGIHQVHFAVCVLRPHEYACKAVRPERSAKPDWPPLHACVGDARCATAYAISKARARVVAAAWDARARGSTECPARVWGGRSCGRDPFKLNRYLEPCSAPPVGGAGTAAAPCRALVVGLDWEAPAHRFTVGATSQRGLFLQDRVGFGSTLSTQRSAGGKLVRVPARARALGSASRRGGGGAAGVANCTAARAASCA